MEKSYTAVEADPLFSVHFNWTKRIFRGTVFLRSGLDLTPDPDSDQIQSLEERFRMMEAKGLPRGH